VPISRCRVSYIDTDGVAHAGEVDAESLYEAVAPAEAEFRGGDIITDTPAAMTEFCVTVLRTPNRAPHPVRQGSAVGAAHDEERPGRDGEAGLLAEAFWSDR